MTIWASYVWSDLANLDVLHVSHAVDHSFDCSLNGKNAPFCCGSSCGASLFRVILELVNQFLDCLSADLIVFLDS